MYIFCISIYRWAFVEVESKTTWPDDMQAFAAGMAEGYLTKDLIYYSWRSRLEVTENISNANLSHLNTTFLLM